ncbi:MAG: hypothetical protein EZS28_041694, partial [Streblomastix strix]
MAKGAKFTRMKNSTGVSITIALAKGEFDTLQEVIASAQASISSHRPLALNDAQMNEYSAQDYSNTQQTRSQQTPSTLNSSLLATIPTSLVGQLPQSLRKYIDKQKIQESKDMQRYKFSYQSVGLTFPQKFTVLHQLKLNEFEFGVKRRHNIYLILEGGNFENKDTKKKAHCILTTDKQTLLGYYQEAASGWIYLAALDNVKSIFHITNS